jgi:hypothetical protein
LSTLQVPAYRKSDVSKILTLPEAQSQALLPAADDVGDVAP